MIKSDQEVTLKTKEAYFVYRKPQKLKFAKNVFRKLFSKNSLKTSFFGKSHSAEKTTVASYRRNDKLGVSLKLG